MSTGSTDAGEASPAAFRVGSSIPVIPMLDESGTLAFYVEFLGF